MSVYGPIEDRQAWWVYAEVERLTEQAH